MFAQGPIKIKDGPDSHTEGYTCVRTVYAAPSLTSMWVQVQAPECTLSLAGFPFIPVQVAAKNLVIRVNWTLSNDEYP